MSKSRFYARQELSVEVAWGRTFLEAVAHPSCELAPFTVCISSASGLVVPDTSSHPLVTALNACLESGGHQDVEKVAFPLFPERLWKVCSGDRQEFYAEFLRNQRSYAAWLPMKNRGGMYFGRLIGFGVHPKTGKDLGFTPSNTLAKEGNQLEHVIKQCRRSVELGKCVARMQLQATTFDPYRDLATSGQPCFPCLQHISFDPDIKGKTLALSAFYATQQLFVKAFGNWLGLCRLGSFVAEQSGLKFTRFTCFVGVEKMDIAPKNDETRANLIRAAQAVVEQASGTGIVEETSATGRMVAAHVG
jgi:hypothetical protein